MPLSWDHVPRFEGTWKVLACSSLAISSSSYSSFKTTCCVLSLRRCFSSGAEKEDDDEDDDNSEDDKKEDPETEEADPDARRLRPEPDTEPQQALRLSCVHKPSRAGRRCACNPAGGEPWPFSIPVLLWEVFSVLLVSGRGSVTNNRTL